MAQQVEAEDGTNAGSCGDTTELAGYTGTGEVKNWSLPATITFSSFAPSDGAGTYTISARIADPYGSTTKSYALTVNSVAAGTLSASCTQAVWKYTNELTIALNATGNTIVFTPGQANNMIDNFILTKQVEPGAPASKPKTNVIILN